MGSIRQLARLALFIGLIAFVIVSCSRTPTGRPEMPWISFDDDGISFGRILVGGDTTFAVPLSFNHIPRDRGLSFVATDARFQVTPSSWDPSDLVPEELFVRFAPVLADSYACWIQVLSGEETVGEVHVDAVVWSPWASLHVRSGRVDFGDLSPGSVNSLGLTLENSPLSSLPCTLEIMTPPENVEVRPLGAVLSPGEILELQLQLVCDGEQRRREDLEIHSNDPFQESVRVEIAGDCRGTPEIEGLPSAVAFDQAAVYVGKTRSVLLSNPGDGTLIMEAISKPEGFKINPERLVIPPDESRVLQIQWIPIETGAMELGLLWETNLAAGDVVLAVTGEAIHGIIPAESLGGILLEMTPEDVEEEFGEPDWILREPGCAVSWNYNIEDAVLLPAEGDSCAVADDTGKAREVAGWNAFPGRTVEGTGTGSTIEQVVREFGLPDVWAEEGPTLWYAYPEDGILFMFLQDHVYLVDVFRPEDWVGSFESLFSPTSPSATLLPRFLDDMNSFHALE